MAQKVGINVDANLDTSAIAQKINALGQQIAQANKQTFTPIGQDDLRTLEQYEKRFKQLVAVSATLRQRLKATGQSGADPLGVDWSAMYPNEQARAQQMRQMFQQVFGGGFHAPIPPGPGGGGSGGGGGQNRPPSPGASGDRGPIVNTTAQVAQAGLRAMGPAGQVAAGAVGTGMSAGFGAGLMGLLGGMLALGVGKLVSSAMEKLDQAEDNSVALDRLKRSLGDVNISFEGLKQAVNTGADNLKITYAEAGRLSSEFAKLGNLSGDQSKAIADELQTGVGLSRAYGLDPSSGVGMMGKMRGVGITSDANESRKFALLIGETIGRAGAFAKADEVMDAIAGYATMQTRNGMGIANVGGFAGMYSAMAGSGIPGLDPAGAGSILMRVNSALSAGGAKGEASQFFTAMLGQRHGLDPFQTQVWREGGAFSTFDEAFGSGSIARRAGMGGPSGGTTLLQGTVDMLRERYGNNQGMLAQATANHLGIGMRQAMALLSVKPNDMGALQHYGGDLSKLSASGINDLSTAVLGDASQRSKLAESMFRRKDVSIEDKARLRAVMDGGDEEAQKRALSTLVVAKGQENTQGSDIRDSKNALDNIKTSIADKLIPITLEMRHGIMAIAGVGNGTSSQDIMKKVLEAESKGRQSSIDGEYDPKIEALSRKHAEATMEARHALQLHGSGSTEAGVAWTKMKEAEQELRDAVEKKHDLTEEENKRRDDEIQALIDQTKARREAEAAIQREKEHLDKIEAERVSFGASQNVLGNTPGGPGGYSEPWAGTRPGSGRGGGGLGGAAAADAIKYFMEKGWTKEQASGIVANLVAESNLRPGAVGDGGKAYGVAQWHPDRQENFRKWAGKDIRQATLQEQYDFVHYEMTQGAERAAGRRLQNATTAAEAGAVVSRYYERPKHRDAEARKRAGMAEDLHATPLPPDAPTGSGRNDVHVTVEPLEVMHRNDRGEQVMPTQALNTRVQTLWRANA